MKMKTTIILAAISLSVVTTSAFAESDSYIICEFDDFDTNSEVINTTSTQATEKTVPAASENYIAWTFDDFDNNCDVINSTTIQADEEAAMLAVFYEKDVSDEIGW